MRLYPAVTPRITVLPPEGALGRAERQSDVGISSKTETRCHISRFPAVKIFKNEIFEKREIVAARFSFWGNA
jgi:hypothetical protein